MCNSLGIVIDWEKSQLVAHQESFLPRSPIGLCQFPGFSSSVTSQQASLNWLPVSIMSGSTCVFLARVDEDVVLSDTAHSGGTAADAVVPVALHRPWVRLDSEALGRWSSEIRQDLFWWWGHKRLELVSSLGRVSPQFNLWSDSSDVGWALVSIFFGVPSGP